jgi:transcription elongation factor
MNADLQKLLELTPGVFCNRSGAIRQQIDFDDGIKLLEMHQNTRQPDVGNWVQIRKGIYERDVGYVLSANTCGVELLLIPRLPPPEATISHSNRDRSTPALFDYEIIHQPYDIKPVRIHDNTYSFRGNRFKHGLVVKFYVFDSVSTNVPCMPYEMCCLFLESQHPRLITARSTFPKPSEWHFASGDEVYSLDFTHGVSVNGKRGHVTALRSNSVDFMTKEGVLNNVGWLFICKVIHEGDFVEITGGDYQGQTGWVDQVVYQKASIVRVLEKHSAISLSERTDVCGY